MILIGPLKHAHQGQHSDVYSISVQSLMLGHVALKVKDPSSHFDGMDSNPTSATKLTGQKEKRQ